MIFVLNLNGCFNPAIFLRPPTTLQLVEEGLADEPDIHGLLAFRNPPGGDSRSSIRDFLYLFLKSETRCLKTSQGAGGETLSPSDSNSYLHVQDRIPRLLVVNTTTMRRA
jgi:hypothetical protein